MISVFTLTLVGLISNVFATIPTLLILSFEDFNPELCTNDAPVYFNNLRPKGAGPVNITSIFPVTTFSNHFNIATGVQSDVHGIYNDLMFDSEGNVITPSKEQFQFNEDIVPIWTENQKAGDERISGVMMWPGAEYEYHGVTPTYVQPHDTTIEWSKRADMIVDWMTRSDKRANLVMAYFEKTTKCYNANEIPDHINDHHSKIDDVIKQINEKLEEVLGNSFHMIILSDHGTQDVEANNFMDVNVCVDNRTNIIVSGAMVFVHVAKEDQVKAYEELNNKEFANLKYQVYNRKKIQTTFFIDIPTLENVIILLAKQQYAFMEIEKLNQIVKDLKDSNIFKAEVYGFDHKNLEMYGYFAGFGPKFKTNLHTNDSFSITDIYAMIKLLLELPNNASEKQKIYGLHSSAKEIMVDDLFPKNTEQSENDGDNNNEKSENDGDNNDEKSENEEAKKEADD